MVCAVLQHFFVLKIFSAVYGTNDMLEDKLHFVYCTGYIVELSFVFWGILWLLLEVHIQIPPDPLRESHAVPLRVL